MSRKMTGKTKSEKAAYWRAHVEKFKKHPGSSHDYCLSEQISHSTFQNWRRQLEATKTSGFVPVVVTGSELPAHSLKHQRSASGHLPNAVWVAELILRLQQGAR